MELYELLFLICFLTTLVITLVKTINILSGWQVYNIKEGLTMFIVYVMMWGTMFIVSLLYINVLLLSTLFKLANGFFALNGLFLVIEIIYLLVTTSQKQRRTAHNARKFYEV